MKDVHSKVIVADDKYTMIGSFNWLSATPAPHGDCIFEIRAQNVKASVY
ncbi:hypothetical protein [Vibrio coralliilyticus]